MKFNFRKIASVLTSTVMLTSTVALAAAANYPAPFVQGGNANVAVVYGSNAAVTDLVAVGDINTDLQAKLAAQTAVSGSSGSSVSGSGGDFVQLDRPSSKLHVGNGLVDVFGRSVTDTDLPELLAKGTFTSDGDNKDHDYNQKIDVANLTLAQFEDSDYKEDTPTLGMRIASSGSILNYTLEFTDKPDFNNNLENSDIVIMGKNYYVLDQQNGTSPSLTLLDSAATQSFNEGETKSVTIGNQTYDVTVTDVTSDNKVKLSVAGKTSSSLAIGSTYKVAEGAYIGVKDAVYKSKDNAVSRAELSLGAGKLTLQNGADVELNDNSINNLVARIVNTSTISKIILEWKADDDQFVTSDSSVSMPGFGGVKLSLAGMVWPNAEEVNVNNDGKYTIELKAPIKDGDASIAVLSNNVTNSNFTIVGKDTDNYLRTSGTSSLTFDADTDENFVASWASGKDAETYILYATSFRDDNGVNKTTVKGRVGSYEQEVQQGDTVVLGNVQLTVGYIDKNAKTLALTAGSGSDFHTLYTKSGLKVYLPFYSATSKGAGAVNNTAINATNNGFPSTFNLVFSEEDKDGNIAAGNNVTVAIGKTSSDNYATVSSISFTGTPASFQEMGNSNVFQDYVSSALATFVQWDQGPDQETAKLTYHGGESYGQVVLSDLSASVTGGSSGTGNGQVKSLGSVSVSDNEVASVSGRNLIVVGGSCVNMVAAKLLGSNSPLCGSDWEQATGVGSGSFLVQTFASPYASSNIATLVAGYNSPDTTNAAKALTTQSVDTTVGKKYTGSVANAITLATSSS